MPNKAHLEEQLREIDGRGYKAYKSLDEAYDFPGFVLRVDHVQGDPFADPTRLSALVPPASANLPGEALQSRSRLVSVADYLNRRMAAELGKRSSDLGSGRSGELSILRPGQEVLHRTSMFVHEDGSLEARFRAGLPARGRRVLADAAVDLLCSKVPAAVEAAFFEKNLDGEALLRHMYVVEDAQALREQLQDRKLVAFIADGAKLPRRTGIDDRPLEGPAVVPFESPDSLRVTLETPHSGPVTGMGVPEGVTLLVGGGFHGKSTLLRAIERGVYDHVAGDGRERVVARPDAVKVRAEDGRAVAGTDISNFINDLPGGEDTGRFLTENASGSTSQAAAIAEALEMGSRCLLLDEDTSATNFLIRDARVQALIAAEHEPITPFIDRVQDMRTRGISVVIVVGGSGDYFDVADTVIAMRKYRPMDVTADAAKIAADLPSRRRSEERGWSELRARIPLPESIDPSRGHRRVEVRTFGAQRMKFGTQEVDLAAVEQLVESAQTQAIGRALAWGREEHINGVQPMQSALESIMEKLKEAGLDLIDDRLTGDYAEFRGFELAAVLNRVRGFETQ